jgi:hypothetical protein
VVALVAPEVVVAVAVAVAVVAVVAAAAAVAVAVAVVVAAPVAGAANPAVSSPSECQLIGYQNLISI